MEQVYGVKPDLTREGGSIPVTLTFQVISFLSRNWIILYESFCILLGSDW